MHCSTVLNGEKPDYLNVTSSDPQGSVLGSLLFLVHINDKINGKSNIRLFANDCIIFIISNDSTNINTLQSNPNKISDKCAKWRTILNVKKCIHMRFTTKKSPITADICLILK